MKKFRLQILLLCASFLLAINIPLSNLIKTIVAIPGIIILFSFLLDIILEKTKHFYEIVRQEGLNDFALGTGSHMAMVAYDKHVQFCEEYINEIEKTFDELTRNGTSIQTGLMVVPLVKIRRKYTAWLTSKLEKELIEYERILIHIGNSHLKKEFASEHLDIEKYAKSIDEDLISLLGNSEKSIRETSIEHIREILEIDALAEIRSIITREAKNRLILKL